MSTEIRETNLNQKEAASKVSTATNHLEEKATIAKKSGARGRNAKKHSLNSTMMSSDSASNIGAEPEDATLK